MNDNNNFNNIRINNNKNNNNGHDSNNNSNDKKEKSSTLNFCYLQKQVEYISSVDATNVKDFYYIAKRSGNDSVDTYNKLQVMQKYEKEF